jgi:hypothetical protein
MAAFEYRQALEIRDACARHQVKYLFIGKSGAILLGYPDTTQDADLFIEKSTENGERLVQALGDLGFSLSAQEAQEIREELSSRLRAALSTSTWSSLPMASKDSTMPGNGGST